MRQRSFMRVIEKRLSQSNARERPFVLLSIDLTRINWFEHSISLRRNNAINQELIATLANLLAKPHLLCRRDQTSFLALVEMPPNRTQHEIDQKIFGVRKLPTHDTLRLSVALGATVGGTQFPQRGTDWRTLIEQADMACSEAKRFATRQKIMWYSPRLYRQRQRRTDIAVALRQAIHNHDIKTYYQPVVELPTGNITGFEALARWNCPGHGEVSALEFIALAEQTNLIVLLTTQMIEQVLIDMPKIKAKFPHATIALNISPKLFINWIIVDMLEDLANKQQLPKDLILEITENELPMRLSHLKAQIKVLRRLGLKIALDDFGRGYSSLSRLANLPLDQLKIDKSLVSLNRHDTDKQIIRTIISLGSLLGLTVIAEGLETKAQMQDLVSAGCMQGQGWYYAQALPIEKAMELPSCITPIRPISKA